MHVSYLIELVSHASGLCRISEYDELIAQLHFISMTSLLLTKNVIDPSILGIVVAVDRAESGTVVTVLTENYVAEQAKNSTDAFYINGQKVFGTPPIVKSVFGSTELSLIFWTILSTNHLGIEPGLPYRLD